MGDAKADCKPGRCDHWTLEVADLLELLIEPETRRALKDGAHCCDAVYNTHGDAKDAASAVRLKALLEAVGRAYGGTDG